jgi:hypothetical protein
MRLFYANAVEKNELLLGIMGLIEVTRLLSYLVAREILRLGRTEEFESREM